MHFMIFIIGQRKDGEVDMFKVQEEEKTPPQSIMIRLKPASGVFSKRVASCR